MINAGASGYIEVYGADRGVGAQAGAVGKYLRAAAGVGRGTRPTSMRRMRRDHWRSSPTGRWTCCAICATDCPTRNQCQPGVAEKTVKVHIAAIFKTLNVVNRTQAAVSAGCTGRYSQVVDAARSS